jgi:hypothetical protein
VGGDLVVELFAVGVHALGQLPGQRPRLAQELFQRAAGHVALGLELLVIATAMIAIAVRLPILTGDATRREELSWKISRWSVRAAAMGPLWLGGLFELLAIGGALYWVTAGVAFAIVGAVASAWVLLVEILR